MGLKKLFSSNSSSKKEEVLNNYQHKRNSIKSSSLSLSQSISNWTHKEKSKSLNINTSESTKRYSHPSPPNSTASLKAISNERHSLNINRTTPVTPSDSMRDVNEVVHVLRNSASSELLSSSVFTEEDAHVLPIAIKEEMEEETNPFLRITPLQRQSQVYYPPNILDSNKYECEEPSSTPDSVTTTTTTTTNMEEDALYNELLQVALQLETTQPENAVILKQKLKEINASLMSASEKSNLVHTRLLSVIEHSKQTILATTERNKELIETQESLKLELEQLQDSHNLALSELAEGEDLAVAENKELKKQLDEKQDIITAHTKSKQDILLLFNQDDQIEEEHLRDKMKQSIALAASAKLLQSQLDTLHSNKNDLEQQLQDYQALQAHAEELTNQVKVLEEQILANEARFKADSGTLEDKEKECQDLINEINALKNGSSEDARINSTFKEQLEKQAAELISLKESTDTMKSENAKLQTQINLAQQQLIIADQQANELRQLEEKMKRAEFENTELKQEAVEMETVSKETARAVIEENEKLEQRIQDMESEHLHTLSELRIENKNLTQLVKQLQEKADKAIHLKRQPSVKTREQDQQEELMHMHTKAQLGLIEYLEGEENIALAMARLKKGLEERI